MTVQPVHVAVPAPNGLHRPVMRGISVLVHAPAKSGKSTFGDSGPAPRLLLDVEGGSSWTPSRKIEWRPMHEPPPRPDGSWDSAVVVIQDSREITQCHKILYSGQHPFSSVSIDSITEFQQRIIDDIAGTRKIERDQWGMLLRQVNHEVRKWRDLLYNPYRKLWGVTFIAGTDINPKTGKWEPMVQGGISNYLPYHPDILGYIEVDPATGTRWLIIGPHPQYATGERVGGKLPPVMPLAYPGRAGWTLESMVRQVISS